jgi:hypothetical protein
MSSGAAVPAHKRSTPAEPGASTTLWLFAEMSLPRAAGLALFVIACGAAASDAVAQRTPGASPHDAQPRSAESGAAEQRPDEESGSPARGDGWHGRIELKRQNTSRGTPEESTKTTLRVETFFRGPVEMLRFDFPFPDEETDFSGSPFNPRLGDIKTRVRFRALEAGGYSFPSFVEVTFPTADPESLGTGKYQLSAGIRMLAPLALPFPDPAAHKSRLETEVQQVNSVGGDPDRKDINYTKFELTLYDIWRRDYTFKLKLKPSVDWVMDGRTGAVGEVEVGLFFARDWRTWLMLGRRLWGPPGIGGTYDDRVELGLARTF